MKSSTWRQAAWILSLSLAAAVLSAFFHPMRPPWYYVVSEEVLRWQISVEEAAALAETEEILWIDARPRQKFEESHLEGAILLNPDEWGKLMYENMDTLQTALDNPVIVYCDGERCAQSAEVARRLRELLGLDPVHVLKGDWRSLERSLE